MNMKQLEAFVHIAEEKNFTKAAKLLYMTQPAISFQIKALEGQIGVQLFERMDKKVFLTNEGELLYPKVKQILTIYKSMKEDIMELKGLEKGKLVIGASTIPGEYILPSIIGQFKATYPGVSVTLDIGSTHQILTKLEERKLDIAIIGAKPDNEKFETFIITQDELVLIGPIDFPENQITLERLKNLPFIMRELGSGTRKIIEKEMDAIGESIANFNVQMELGSTRAILTAVESGLGFSFVSRWAVKETLKLEKLKLLTVKNFALKRCLFGAINPDKYTNSVTKAFQSYIRKINLLNNE